MEEKIWTLVIKVDLECCKCYRKIRKVLCQLQECMNIRTIAYDEKNNTVTVSGPFDPHELSRRLRCKACKVIMGIEIIEPPKPKPPPPPKEEPKPKPPPPPKEEPKPKPPPPPPKEEPKPKPPPPPPKEEPKPKPPPPPIEEPKPKPPPPPKEEPKPPPPPKVEPVPVCCCRPCPCYDGYHGGHRCCSCGVVYVFSDGPPLVYGKPWYDGYSTFFCEEQPSSCTIM